MIESTMNLYSRTDGPRYYILTSERVVCRATAREWSAWYNNPNNSCVDDTTTPDGCRVSTVFLGLDHGMANTGPPIIFETMIFDGQNDGYMERCSTYEQALEMHRRAIKLAGEEKTDD